MFEESIVRYGAPTLMGLKTGALFSYLHQSIEQVKQQIRIFNQKYVKKGLRLLPLRMNDHSVLLYMYRPSLLHEELLCSECSNLLQACGYDNMKQEYCIVELVKRLNQQQDFPHEIGIFLGYPIEDVIGFIENKSRCEKWIGTWKVYGDVSKAKKLCKQYDECTQCCLNLLKEGKSLDDLMNNKFFSYIS